MTKNPEVSLKHKKVIMITRTNHKVNNSRKTELREVTGYLPVKKIQLAIYYDLFIIYVTMQCSYFALILLASKVLR